jgi:hypothetical protein
MTGESDQEKWPRRARKDVPKERLCLRCRKAFWSEGFGERICQHCKKSNSWQTQVQSVRPPGRRH